MKKWDIPVSWREGGIIEVEADTLEKAIEIARDKDEKLPLPEGYYIGKWNVDYDIDTIRNYYNLGQT